MTLQRSKVELQATANGNGVARFDSLPVGMYSVRVRRIGCNTTTFLSFHVRAGCRTDVEVYLSISLIGIAPPPPMPPRSSVTVCSL